MKLVKKMLFVFPVLFTALLVIACGSGGGDAPVVAPPSQNVGVITAKGSVVVNGITFNTTGATVIIDDNPSPADLLQVGMVVNVRGNVFDGATNGSATHIEARDTAEGTIEAVGVNTITVMGQVVRIEDNVTRLNDDDAVRTFAAANFLVGDRVEVHAFPDDQGGLRATRVAKKLTNEFEVKGFVTVITGNSFGLSLTPGGTATLTVNFTGALPAGVQAGSYVEVKAAGAPAGAPPAVTATSIALEDAIGAANDKVKVEGVITSGTINDFMVNGKRVLTTSATLFEGGIRNEFVIGMKVEAEGRLDAAGAIAATKISFRSSIRLEADATAAGATSLTVIGRTVAINQYTRIDAGPVAAGNHVEVRAFPDRDNNLVAERVVVKGASAKVFVQGPVTVTGGAMTILGLPVNTGAGTLFRISTDLAEAPVSAGTFFASLKSGISIVKARWADAATFTAAGPVEEIEIELGK